MTDTLEVRPTDFCAYGDAARLFGFLSGAKPPYREVILEGVAGCGKTRTVCEWLVEVCARFPGTKILLFRKTRVSMNESVLDTLENEVLGAESPIVTNGPTRAHRAKYEFPGGSEIVCGGMDNPTRIFSTQYHIAWCNEVQELAEDEWELLHRALRRPGGPPFRILGGDCNPDTEQHWANLRCLPDETGRTKALRLVGRFWDNPRYYDHWARAWTAEGREYLQGLCEGLSGVNYQRLFEGKWVAAEGMIWECYDKHRHLITARMEREGDQWVLWRQIGINDDGSGREERIPLEWFAASIDWGHTNPGCLQVWGFDRDSRMFRVAEVYQTKKDREWWAEQAAELYREFRYLAGVCDHDPELLGQLNKRCALVAGRNMPALWRRAHKTRSPGSEMAGIDEVRIRLRQGSLFLVRGALRGIDPALRRARKPTCLEEEIPQYVYPVSEDGKRDKEDPAPGCANHACDAARYMAHWALLKDLSPRVKLDPTAPPKELDNGIDIALWQREIEAARRERAKGRASGRQRYRR